MSSTKTKTSQNNPNKNKTTHPPETKRTSSELSETVKLRFRTSKTLGALRTSSRQHSNIPQVYCYPKLPIVVRNFPAYIPAADKVLSIGSPTCWWMTLSRVGFLANTSISGQSVRIATLHETHTILVSSYHHRVPLDPEGSKRMMEARQARVHYGQGSDSDVVWRFRYPGTCYWPSIGEGLQVVPTSESVCWSPSEWFMFCTSGAQGPKRSRVRDCRPSGQRRECPRNTHGPQGLSLSLISHCSR